MGGGQDMTPNEFLRKIKRICLGRDRVCKSCKTGSVCPLYTVCSPAFCVDDIDFLENDRAIDDFVTAVYNAKED